MKKLKKLLIFVLLVTSIAVFTSCKGEDEETAPTTITDETPIEEFISVVKFSYFFREISNEPLDDFRVTIQQLRSSGPLIIPRDYNILYLEIPANFNLTSISFRVIASENTSTSFYTNPDFVQNVDLIAYIFKEVEIIIPSGELELQQGNLKIFRGESSEVANIQIYNLKINGR